MNRVALESPSARPFKRALVGRPMATNELEETLLPKTLAFGWLVRTVSQRVAPSRSDSASSRGLPFWATGTYAAAPPGAFGSIAAVPLIGWPTFFDHMTFPVTASRA